LDRLQRFHDGPIPAPERRWIFADPDPVVRSASARWNDLAGESAERVNRLRHAARAAASFRARNAACDALAVEMDWQRHCRARAVETRREIKS